ncbi:hypothetical protein C9374_012078 [Naegleria lovaniensis]|uniref:MYND-type domain-containing protein n=1 Tax=Naegleria lovaniensis TaxID=51637 RepID=A0AA88GG78_NAELO|nr:uncharacterized protein C9374_012078 [Naegleria lovaniensis]KAG2373471.1 hypothetical protein C9374_012078 [Naegleria lovaniensis]
MFNFASLFGSSMKANCNNPSQPLLFETYDQFLYTRVFPSSGGVTLEGSDTSSSSSSSSTNNNNFGGANIAHDQIASALKVVKTCNVYEKHELDSASSTLPETQRNLLMLKAYYTNPSKEDTKFLHNTLRESLMDFAGSPGHDTAFSSSSYKTKQDFNASKKAHEIYHSDSADLSSSAEDPLALDTKALESILKAADQCLKMSPNCIEAYNALAMYKAKSFEEALAFYRQGQSKFSEYYSKEFISSMKKSNWTYHDLRQYMRAIIGEANTLRKMGRYEEALAAYYRAEKIDPEVHSMMVSYINFQMHIPECLMRLGKWREAYQFMKKKKDLLELSSSKVLLWSFALCDFVVNQRTPNHFAGEDMIKYSESHDRNDLAHMYGPLWAATNNAPLVYEYLLGIRKLSKVRISKTLSFTSDSPSIVSQVQYVTDHLDLWLSVPKAIEWAIKNCNTAYASLSLSNKEESLNRRYFQKSQPYDNFFRCYSKLLFADVRVDICSTLLHQAVFADSVEAVKLLVDLGASIFSKMEPHAFHVACYYDKSREIVKFFCEKTGNPLRKGQVPQSPLQMAANQGNWKPLAEILSYLLKKKKLTQSVLVDCLEEVFGSSCYECVKGLSKCQRCLYHQDKPHSKDVSFEKCTELLLLFGLEVKKSFLQQLAKDYPPKKDLIKLISDRMDKSVSILPRAFNITDPEVLKLLSKDQTPPEQPSTPKDENASKENENKPSKQSEKKPQEQPSEKQKPQEQKSTKQDKTPGQSAESLKNLGNEEFKKGNNIKAIEYYSKALKQSDSTEIKHILHSNMSACYFNMKAYEKSVNSANEAISCNKTFIKGYLRKATALEALKNYNEALIVVKEAIKLDPDNEALVSMFKKLKQKAAEAETHEDEEEEEEDEYDEDYEDEEGDEDEDYEDEEDEYDEDEEDEEGDGDLPSNFEQFVNMLSFMNGGKLPEGELKELMKQMKRSQKQEETESSSQRGMALVDGMLENLGPMLEQRFEPHKKEVYSWLSQLSNQQKLSIFDETWNSSLTQHASVVKNLSNIKDTFKNVVLNDKFAPLMDAILYAKNNKIQLSKFFDPAFIFSATWEHMPMVQPLFEIVGEVSSKVNDNPILCLLTTIQFIASFSAISHKTWEKKVLSGMAKNSKKEMQDYTNSSLTESHIIKGNEKKKRHCPMCPRIDDEKFTFLPLDMSYDNHCKILNSSKQESLETRKNALIYISKCESHVFEIVTDKVFFAQLKKLLEEEKESAFEVLGNVFAAPHVKAELLEQCLSCVNVLEKDSQFMKKVLSLANTKSITPALCRFLANGAFSSDKFGCMMEDFLPPLYENIVSSFKLSEKKTPHINALRATACFASIPNLRRGMHCLGYGSILYQIQVNPLTCNIDSIAAGMATTAKDWLTSGDKERISYKSKFDPSSKLTKEDRTSLFQCSSKFSIEELPPVQESLFASIKKNGFLKSLTGRFVATVCDGYGIFKLCRVDRVQHEFVVTGILFNAYTQVVRDVLSGAFDNASNCENFLKSYFRGTTAPRPYKTKFPDQPYTSLSFIPDSVALDIFGACMAETVKIRKLNDTESSILEDWKKRFNRPNLGSQKSKSLQDVLQNCLLSDLQVSSDNNRDKTYNFKFYREMMCTPFFHNFYFAVGDQMEFGFMPPFETVHTEITNIHDMLPTPKNGVMDWIVCMCQVIDHVPEAKKFLSNIFTYSASYLKVYGAQSIASDIYSKLQQWHQNQLKAIDLPFIRAFIERTYYYNGQEMLPDGMVVALFKQHGLEHAINTILENSRSRMPARLVPRNEVFMELSNMLARWLVRRKSKNKKPPNIQTYFSKVIPKIVAHPEMGQLAGTLIVSMSQMKLVSIISSIWNQITAKSLKKGEPTDYFELDKLRKQHVEQEKEQYLKTVVESGTKKEETQVNNENSKQQQAEKEVSKSIASTTPLPSTLSTVPPQPPQQKPSSNVKVCAACGKPNATKRCGGCHGVVYCSKECQVAHWKTHKVDCKKASSK